MGNLHSTWSPNTHRHGGDGREGGGPRGSSSYRVGGGNGGLVVGNSSTGVAGALSEGGGEATGGASNNITSGPAALGVPSSGPSTRYSLRRTQARQARTAEANERVTNVSTSSLDSVTSTASGGMTSRRRRREQLDPDETDARGDVEARRRRIEGLERAAFTPETDDDPGQSLFFYFSLPSEALGGRSSATSMNNTSSSNSNSSTASSAPAARRFSGRLQQAAEFLRERLGVGPGRRAHHREPGSAGDANPQPSPFSPLTADAAGSVVGERPMVLVRLRHVQQPSTGPTTANANDGTRASVNNEAVTSNESDAAATASTNADTSSVFQWTIYFVIPRPETMSEGGGGVDETAARSAGSEVPSPGHSSASGSPPSLGPSHFDAAVAVQSAFAVLRALMSGENMSYEDWIRLQEMMGTVSRGVAKELIEEQLPAKLFTPSLGMISCPICLAEYEGGESFRTLPCTHSFHAACIDTWLVTRNDCPLCRQPPVTIPT